MLTVRDGVRSIIQGLFIGAQRRPSASLVGACKESLSVYLRSSSWRAAIPAAEFRKSTSISTARNISTSAIARSGSRVQPWPPPKVSKEVQEYWSRVLNGVDKPTAKRLLSFVDTSFPMGLTPDIAPSTTARTTKQGKPSKPPLYDYHAATKKEHPTKVLLVRVGEFYESIGIDAVLLVQHAGLNPMGDGNPPRAGCPTQNLRRTVMDLVEGAGLSVVVCEETPEPYTYGTMRNKLKDRYVAAIVTPASPHLLHGLVDEDTDLVLESAPPLLGIAPTVGGYSVIEVDAELQSVSVTEGLTEDAVYARLHEGGLAPPLYIHVPFKTLDSRLSEATPETEWERRVGSVFRNQVGVVTRYSDPDPVKGMLSLVRRQLGLQPNEPFTIIKNSSKDRPRPLYFSTASNLGLHKTRGVPSLLDYILPPGAPLTARRWLRKLLLLPPPPATAASIQQACRSLKELNEPIPDFPVMSPANIVLKLRNKEANDTFYREVASLCKAVETACTSSSLEELSNSLLLPTQVETGIHNMTKETLAQACREAVQEIHEAVHHDESIGTGIRDLSKYPDVLQRMIAHNEDFQGKIRAEMMPEVYHAVDAAREALAEQLDIVQQFLKKACDNDSTLKSKRPGLTFDIYNNAIWLKMPPKTAIDPSITLRHPTDRNGKLELGVYTTDGLHNALDDYRKACADAETAVRQELKALAERLQRLSKELVCASTFAVIAFALENHVREANRIGWTLPTLAYGSDATQAQIEYSVENMWPYWLSGLDNSTVKNSFEMKNMFLLTGPNMAGKSTLLRSACAVALLGACGLHVPAAHATLPYIDAFMLRNFSSDSPLEGRSSFAVEMTEMRYLLEDATASSLVLVDELGKGTEVKAGAALAGAMLERLDAIGCKGVFATHLHIMLDLNLNLPRTIYKAMETTGDGGRKHATWKMIDGICTESLALEVAQSCRLPCDIVSRARELYTAAEEVDISSATVAPLSSPLPKTSRSSQQANNNTLLLSEAASILETVTRNALSELTNGSSMSDVLVQYVPAGMQPPPRTVGASCVYIARRQDGWFYVGSTDSLKDRIAAHRKKSGSSRVKDPEAEFAYVALAGNEGAAAKAIEAAMIRAMQVAEYPLLSVTDSRRKHSPNMAGEGE